VSPPVDDDDLAKVRRITNHAPLDASAICTTVDVHGACAPLVGQAPRPALVFQFTHADSTVLMPIVLVLDESEICRFADLLHVEAHRALAKTDQIRRLS
jgi:hypothetical protein